MKELLWSANISKNTVTMRYYVLTLERQNLNMIPTKLIQNIQN